MEATKSHLFCKSSESVFIKDKSSDENHSGIKLFEIELLAYYTIVDFLLKYLSPIEIERANKYHFLKDRNRFIICRSLLKILLAEETGLQIEEIQIKKHSNHKPYLPVDLSLFFNIAHSGNYAIIAIGNCDLGVDIEHINYDFDFTEILPNVFSEIETDLITSSNNKTAMFYKLWTRKEAIVKATGQGINENLIHIPTTDGSHKLRPSLVSNYKNIRVYSVNLNENYIASLAVSGITHHFDSLYFHPVPSADKLLSSYSFNL